MANMVFISVLSFLSRFNTTSIRTLLRGDIERTRPDLLALAVRVYKHSVEWVTSRTISGKVMDYLLNRSESGDPFGSYVGTNDPS